MLIMVELAEIGIILQTIGVLSAATAAVIGVRSYINSNKRVDEAKKKEQETRERELETRQAQMFMNIHQALYSPWFEEQEFILLNSKLKNFEDWNKLQKNKELWTAFGSMHAYYEGIGILVKDGLLDIRLVAQNMSGALRWFWESHRDMVFEARKELKWPRLMIEVEYLYNALNEYAAKHPEFQVASPQFKD
jgi:hypothetical protein